MKGVFFVLYSALASAQGPSLDVLRAMSCEDVIAHAEDSRGNMMMAGSLLTTGMWMGDRCIEPDYERGFDLLHRLGDDAGIDGAMRDLRRRAGNGNRTAKKRLVRAEAALEKLGLPAHE